MTRPGKLLFPAVVATCLIALVTWTASACPFCDPVTQTLSEEIASMDAVALVELVELPKFSDDDEELAKAKFKVVSIIKGASLIGKTKIIEAIYFGDPKPKQKFLVMGVDPPKIMWSTPLAVSERAISYMSKLPTLPESGAARLEFFQGYLEDKDETLARDSYDEFAKAPYAVVKQLKSKLRHDKLVGWIQNPDIPGSRRRLYLTLLGVCGSEKDLPLLEKLLVSEDRRFKTGLDALVACYLTLKKTEGLALIEDLFLKNPDSEYADTYATIMALRFHGKEGTVISQKRILKSLHYMLERPQLADLVIPDLARWKDWSQVDRLVKLFKDADEKSSWVRVPVVNYLRQCPLPEAKKHIALLEKIDPAAVRRANTFFPFQENGTADSKKEEKKKDKSATGSDDTAAEDQPPADGALKPVGKDDNSKCAPEEEATVEVAAQVPAVIADAESASADQNSSKPDSTKSPQVASRDVPDSAVKTSAGPNILSLIGVSLLAGLGLLVLQWSILRGAGSTAAR